MPTHWSAQAGLNISMSNQISRTAASAVRIVPPSRAVSGSIRGSLTMPAREQPAGGEQGLGDDGPLDHAAGDEILAAGKPEAPA